MSAHKGARSRVTLRVPRWLMCRIRERARADGVDVNTLIERELEIEATRQEQARDPHP